jgi:hypothetical protein
MEIQKEIFRLINFNPLFLNVTVELSTGRKSIESGTPFVVGNINTHLLYRSRRNRSTLYKVFNFNPYAKP